MVDSEIWKYTTKYVGNDAGFINTHFEEMKQLLKGSKYITADFFRKFVIAFQKNYQATKTIELDPNITDPDNILDVGIDVANMTNATKDNLNADIVETIREKEILPEVRAIMNNTFLDNFINPNNFFNLKAELARQITEYRDDPLRLHEF